MVKNRIELAVSAAFAAEVDALCASVQKSQRAALARYESVPEEVRRERGLALPVVASENDIIVSAIHVGTRHLLGCAPNTVVSLNRPETTKQYQRGETFSCHIALPIGVRILVMTASPADGPNWSVTNICFGTLNVINSQGTAGGVALSELTYLTCKDLLSAFDGQTTKSDMTVLVTMICKTDGATFDGYRLHLYEEEQWCYVQARLAPAEPSARLDADRDKFEAAALRDDESAVQCSVRFLCESAGVVSDLLAQLRDKLREVPGATSVEVTLDRRPQTFYGACGAPPREPTAFGVLIRVPLRTRTPWAAYLKSRETVVSTVCAVAAASQAVPDITEW